VPQRPRTRSPPAPPLHRSSCPAARPHLPQLLDKADEATDRKLARHLVALYGADMQQAARVSRPLPQLAGWRAG
jgi:hypothetical protein